ncbi:hypothetical protein AVEN_259863-1 [Araneus ventricosus]|uniref:Uncharacterized protein n=1 Tax=Araneus ventricosus TaxID=182803 RepID=A0A4Y2DT24_ARAVE|nr:hypothetical protein AVEN_259863-1 [Araneus ventricosus]
MNSKEANRTFSPVSRVNAIIVYTFSLRNPLQSFLMPFNLRETGFNWRFNCYLYGSPRLRGKKSKKDKFIVNEFERIPGGIPAQKKKVESFQFYAHLHWRCHQGKLEVNKTSKRSQ